jgi:hypothetical protein
MIRTNLGFISNEISIEENDGNFEGYDWICKFNKLFRHLNLRIKLAK